MPNYNCAAFIAEAIDSVMQQSFTDWELIICDDNSTDDSVKIINGYAAQDKRIRLIMNDKQIRGSGHCRNLAIRQATGEYLALLDSDDIWYRDKLEKQLAFMKESNIEISYTSYDVMRENGEKIKTITPTAKIKYVDMLKGKWMHTSTIVAKKSIPVEFPELRTGQDIAMWLKLFREHNYTGYGLLQSLMAYRLRTGSSSSNKLQTIRLHWARIKHLEKTPYPQAVYYYSCYVANMIKKYVGILPEVLRIR